MQKISDRSIPIYPANLAIFKESGIFGFTKRFFWTPEVPKRDMIWNFTAIFIFSTLRIFYVKMAISKGGVCISLVREQPVPQLGSHHTEGLQGAFNYVPKMPRDVLLSGRCTPDVENLKTLHVERLIVHEPLCHYHHVHIHFLKFLFLCVPDCKNSHPLSWEITNTYVGFRELFNWNIEILRK